MRSIISKRIIQSFLYLFITLLLTVGFSGVGVSTDSPLREASSPPDKRPLSPENYYRMESVGGGAISPDGRQVAFVRTYILEEKNSRHSEIWLVPVDGSKEPVRLTNPAFSSSKPRWSPDGRLLAFSSFRKSPGEEERVPASVWFLRMDKPMGKAYQIEGVDRTPIFSPNNRWIVFTKQTPPGPKPEKKYASDFERKIDERFRGRMYDWMNYRFDRRGYLPNPRDLYASPPQELYIVSRKPGTPRQITRLGFNVQGPTWSPDSSALAFTADSHQRDEYTYERADLWIVDAEGQIKRLTNDGYHYSNPAWSPDGKFIVVRGYQGLSMIIQSKQGYGSPTDLFLMPAEGGTLQNLTKSWDLIPGSPQWSPDGRFIYFSSSIGGNSHLFRLPANGGPVEQVTKGNRRLRSFSFSSNFKYMAYYATDPTHPGDIFFARIDGEEEKRLTESNKKLLGEILFSPSERIIYKSKDGTQIEGWIMYPYGYDPDQGLYPMILTIHGGPHSAYGNDFSFHRQFLAANGYFVLYTNPRSSTGYGEKFRWATWGGWGILDYQDLMAAVDYVLKHYPIDEKRLGVTGNSYGGFMTNWIIGHTKRFAAAVARASISNWVSDYGVADIPRTKESEFYGPPWEKKSRDLMIKLSPLTYAGNVITPTLFIHGELDHRVPIEEAEQIYVALKKRRVPAMFIRYPDSYHGGWSPWRTVHRMYYELKWWQKYLQKKSEAEE